MNEHLETGGIRPHWSDYLRIEQLWEEGVTRVRVTIVPFEWSCEIPQRDPEHLWEEDAADTTIFGLPVKFGADRLGEWLVFRFPSGWTVNFTPHADRVHVIYGHWNHDRAFENVGHGPFACDWERLLGILRDLSEREEWAA